MTDPAIHSAIGDFGRDNKRAMGIAKFFETHVCNSICEQLNLTKQKWITPLYQDFIFIFILWTLLFSDICMYENNTIKK